MYPSGEVRPNRQPSRSASKRRFKNLASRIKPGLALDTSFSRHRGKTPLQVFPDGSAPRAPLPYESKTHEQSSLDLRQNAGPTPNRVGIIASPEHRQPVRPEPERSISVNVMSTSKSPPRPGLDRSKTAAGVSDRLNSTLPPPIHKRVKGLRPSPLDLEGISPSDRAIPIGIAVSSASLSHHITDQQSAAPYPNSPPRQLPSHTYTLEPSTPMIVITPAREDFDLPDSPEHGHAHRASSMYSRYTNCVPKPAKLECTPPVPALPLFAHNAARSKARETTAVVDEDVGRPRTNTASMCTVFEEDSALPSATGLPLPLPRQMTPHSALQTPRRSQGWWNLITSPFSARSNSFFWRSPTDEDPDHVPILRNASDMGTSDCALDESEIRSAPPAGSRPCSVNDSKLAFKRSMTAPGALPGDDPRVDIYRIPSQGEAAAYYDPSRHFPSLVIDPNSSLARSAFDDDSPLTDVCHCDRQRGIWRDDNAITRCPIHHGEWDLDSRNGTAGDRAANPFADGNIFESPEASNPTDRAMSDRPTSTMLQTPTVARSRPVPNRSYTQGTINSQLSPLSATPVVENAHIAHFVGPSSSTAEQRQIMVTPGRTPSPPASSGPGLQAATMASRSTGEADRQMWRPEVGLKKAAYKPFMHSRNSSYGLGISGAGGELFPPPAIISEKRGMGRAKDRVRRPLLRRFFLPLAALIAALLVLMVVLLVIYVPQKHQDMSVQGQWVNLTGYPPLPTGVTTVVQPDAIQEESGCVNPSGLWSCAVSKEQQAADTLGAADQPNFRFEIRFNNATSGNSTALQPAERKRSGVAPSAGVSARADKLDARDAWSDSLYTSVPQPPTEDDQDFLGKTTDNTTALYGGEATPFYISLLDPAPVSNTSAPQKRQDQPYPYPTLAASSNSSISDSSSSGSNSSDSSTATSNASLTAPQSIPTPAVSPDGQPAPATLYPFARAQPLRLYNRGRPDEHYGFYTYFDRSVYVSNSSSNASVTAGVALAAASAVCTWAQTRLQVQIWTRAGAGDLLSGSGGAGSAQDVVGAANGSGSGAAAASTANDMARPGSFPYAVTVSLDRHGGDAGRKGVFCYGLDGGGRVDYGSGEWVGEDRAYGGSLVNPAQVPTGGGQGVFGRGGADGGGGGFQGIDGGTGGCACAWQNWR